MAPDRTPRIVVGVEGSAGSRAALRWAIDEARFRSAKVVVVTAYLPTYIPAAPDFGYVPLEPTDLGEQVRSMQDEVVAEAIGHSSELQVPLEQQLIKGRAAETLIAASQGASLLVVGNRGRGGFRGLLLGSVSQHTAHHAGCPVVIVRSDMHFEEPQ